jgi:hypothetical protein
MMVENAIKHNIVSHARKLHLSIEKKDGRIFVTNTLQPKSLKVASTRSGQKNILERYKLLGKETPAFYQADNLYIAELPVLPVKLKMPLTLLST